MIEMIVCNYLESKLNIKARPEKPLSESECIFVEKTAGEESDYITSATVAIQSYGSSMYKAADLNKKVKAAMRDIVELDNVSAVRYVTDYNFTDTETKQYRYQAVYTVTYYED